MVFARTGGLLATWRREWARFRHTPRLWVLVVVAPLLLALVLLWTFAERSPLGLPLLIADYDRSAASRQLGRQLQAAPTVRGMSTVPDLPRAMAGLRRGEAYGVLVIPPDFERGLLRGESTVLALHYNRQMLTAGNMLLRDVRTVVATTGAGLGVARGAVPAALVELRPAFNPGLDYARFLALPMIIALLHIAVVIVAVDVTGRELREATAGQWLSAAGDSVPRALAGKLLPYALWFSVAGLAFLVVALRVLGVAVAGQPLLWAAGWVALVLACLGLGAALVAATGNLRMALSIASVIVSPAFAYAGLSFPTAFMPALAAGWSLALPLTHGLAAHVQQVAMAAPLTQTLAHIAALLPFMLLPLLLSRRWRRLLRDPARWGAE